ncbi:helix-turn-helix transcriptional regulator [Kitasatospora purpeofusca]|uniref:Helix-turn-helix transcriptional regulator n=1 Tax=Kitasatospora purpeofusca TaxID=67352 RepID=A0ABZ1U997_9ACTN|nr:helix-turn-helix transcriptional regulator [Kitasatospora purpeofusca]
MGGGDPVCPACGAPRAPGVPLPPAAALPLTRALTPRERAVLQLLGLGYDNRSIAYELNISERTVKRFVTAILAKLGLRSRLQAGLLALILASSPADGGFWPKGLMDGVPGGGDDDLASEKEGTMTFDALAALRQAGNPVDLLTLEQRDVLSRLSEDEVAVLNSVKQRLDAVSDAEVEGHSFVIKLA